jgi:hypothetical protein
MVGIGALRCSAANQIAVEATAALRKRSHAALLARLRKAQADGKSIAALTLPRSQISIRLS